MNTDNTYDIQADQGSTLTIEFPIQLEDHSPLNLTGYDVRMQVRRSYGAKGAALINCTLMNGKIAMTDAVGGLVTLTLTPADTVDIKFDGDADSLECVYDMEIQSTVGEVYKPYRGAFVLAREVTR